MPHKSKPDPPRQAATFWRMFSHSGRRGSPCQRLGELFALTLIKAVHALPRLDWAHPKNVHGTLHIHYQSQRPLFANVKRKRLFIDVHVFYTTISRLPSDEFVCFVFHCKTTNLTVLLSVAVSFLNACAACINVWKTVFIWDATHLPC